MCRLPRSRRIEFTVSVSGPNIENAPSNIRIMRIACIKLPDVSISLAVGLHAMSNPNTFLVLGSRSNNLQMVKQIRNIKVSHFRAIMRSSLQRQILLATHLNSTAVPATFSKFGTRFASSQVSITLAIVS